jgi:hypothetical protein
VEAIMIELTPEQRQAVEQGQPVRVVDPTTRDAFVVVRAEVYEKLAGLAPPPPEESASATAPGTLHSMQAFWRDLPELLKRRRNHGKWVAYHGDQLLGIATDDAPLIREVLRRGLPAEAYFLTRIVPTEQPPWEAEEVDPIGR